MKTEDFIMNCIKERPGISAKKIASCLDSTSINPSGKAEMNMQASIFKQLRSLKRTGSVHNRGDRWYAINHAK